MQSGGQNYLYLLLENKNIIKIFNSAGSLNEIGYIRFYNNVIIQWYVKTVSSQYSESEYVDFTLPISFINRAYFAISTFISFDYNFSEFGKVQIQGFDYRIDESYIRAKSKSRIYIDYIDWGTGSYGALYIGI